MSFLDATIVKFLSIPGLDRPVDYLWHLYHIARLNSVTNRNHTEIYKQISANDLDIKSDFSMRDVKALEIVLQQALKEGITIAEIGAWKGMSTSILAKTVIPFNGKVFAVDHWQGSDGVPEHKQAKISEMFTLFRHNMKVLGVLGHIHPLVMSSEIAASIFPSESLDFVFIDADHRYSFVKKDIEIWLPKVKVRGIISGHDCEGRYTSFGDYRKVVDEHLEEDAIPGICHPGVVKALYEIFGNDYSIEPDSSIWWHRK